jgi:hypothetical protein
MNTEEKLDEGLLSNWLFKRNKDARKSYEDTFNVYKDSKGCIRVIADIVGFE